VIKGSFNKIASNVAIEKKVDMNIAIDINPLAYENVYDLALLISGDGDFVLFIKNIRELDKRVEIWMFRFSLVNQ